VAEVRPTFLDVSEFGNPAEVADTDSIRVGGVNTLEDVTMNSNKVTGMGEPTNPQDATTKSYVDALFGGYDPKESVRLATTAALPANTAAGSGVGKTLTADANGALTVDGAAVANGDRVLVKDESVGADVDHGIYTQTQLGTGGAPFILTRATDFDEDDEVTQGARTFVVEGTANQGTGWFVITPDPITVDVTAIEFTQMAGGAGVGGDGIDVSGNVFSVDLANPSGLEFNSGKLRIDVVEPNELTIDANGLNVEGVPLLFNIGATAVGATVTATNLDTVTNGGNADFLHVHSGMGNPTVNTTSGVSIGDPVFPSANDEVDPCDASAANAGRIVGLADATAAAGNPTGIAQDGTILTGVLVGASFGDLVYIASGGGLTTTIPSTSLDRVVTVGKAKNSTDMWVGPFQFLGRVA
jgi:hypothetical protein